MYPLSREELKRVPVLKNKTQGNYVNVSKEIVMDRSLNLKDRGMLLTLLSLPDNWNFTAAGLAKILPDGKAAIYSSLDNLQKAGYLTKEQGRGAGGVFGANIIEIHEKPCSPFTGFPFADNPSPEKLFTEKPVPENRTQLNNNRLNNKELNNHQFIPHQSINLECDFEQLDEIDGYRELVKENIEYEYLVSSNPYKRDLIEEIMNLIVDTIVVRRKQIRIGNVEYPFELVKGKLLKLNMNHIQYVLECMEKNYSKIHNIKSYLLTALYNAPNTIGNYYQAEVNHDMYGGG